MDKLIIDIPDYLQYVQLASARRARYYNRTHREKGKISKKWDECTTYDSKGRLLDKLGNPIIANPKVVGTPRIHKINGQKIYNGDIDHIQRSKVVNAIKDSYKRFLKDLPAITNLPVRIGLELHLPIGDGDWDLDNLWIYNKCFQDAIVDQGIIPDDSIRYLTGSAAPQFVPIQEGETRRLIFTIEPDMRACIRNHPYYAVQSNEGAAVSAPTGRKAGRSKSR